MKRFESEKLHEFLKPKYTLEKFGGLGSIAEWHYAGLNNMASENDIAGYLQDNLQISVYKYGHQLDWEARRWIDDEPLYVSTNKSRTQAIFDCSVAILENK